MSRLVVNYHDSQAANYGLGFNSATILPALSEEICLFCYQLCPAADGNKKN